MRVFFVFLLMIFPVFSLNSEPLAHTHGFYHMAPGLLFEQVSNQAATLIETNPSVVTVKALKLIGQKAQDEEDVYSMYWERRDMLNKNALSALHISKGNEWLSKEFQKRIRPMFNAIDDSSTVREAMVSVTEADRFLLLELLRTSIMSATQMSVQSAQILNDIFE